MTHETRFQTTAESIMQFLNQEDIPQDQIAQTFKNASWRSLVWVVLIMATITAYTAIPKGEPTNPVLIAVPALVTLFFVGLLLWHLRLAFNPRNWLVKMTPNGLYINLQSNTNVPPTANVPTAIFIPKENIAEIGRVLEHRILPTQNGTYKNTFAYFDVNLHQPIPEDLLLTLAQIRRNPALRGPIGRRKDLHGAVRVHDHQTLRLIWDWMSPRELAAEAHFSRDYPIGERVRLIEKKWDQRSPEEQDNYIDTLWEWGLVQDAIHLKSQKESISERKAATMLADRLG